MKKSKSLQAARMFLYFMMYSVIGWLYEVFLEVAVYRWGFSNRGFLYGPYCIIYGIGALLLLLTLGWLKKKRICLGRNTIPGNHSTGPSFGHLLSRLSVAFSTLPWPSVPLLLI